MRLASVRLTFAALALVLGAVVPPSLVRESVSAAPTLVSAENTIREWEATGPEGALVALDGTESSNDAVTFAWWENCPVIGCPEGIRLTDDSALGIVSLVTLAIGAHEIYLWAADAGGDWGVAAPITVTVTEPAPAAPVANAGPDQTVPATSEAGAEVTLDGSASTGATTFVWSTSDGELATGATPTVTLPIGIHEITLTVTGEDEQQATDTVTVTVNPVAVAGDDQTVAATSAEGAAVSLDGTGSYGTSLVWSAGGNPVLAEGTTPDPVLLGIGVHEVTLTASGPDGLTATDTVVITVVPVADAGEDQTVEAGEGGTAEVTLDGSGSIGDLTTIVWSTDGDPDLATGATPTVTLPVGVHEITLTITGPGDVSDTDTVTITVDEPPPPPFVNADATQRDWDATSAEGADVTLDGSLSSDEAVQFAWWEDCPALPCPDGTRLTDDSLDSEVAVVPLAIGAHEITLWAQDGGGQWHGAEPITVTVHPVANAGPDQTVEATSAAGAEVTLDGSASIGEIVSWEWSTDEDPDLATGETATVTLPVGEHEITLTVTDEDEATDTDTVVITVTVPSGEAAATVSPERGTVNTNVSFTLSHFPPEAEVEIVWVRTSGSTIEIGTVQTDAIGGASGTFKVPATPGGANQIHFTSGDTTVTAAYEVAPRIKVIPGTVIPGQVVDVSLRGFGRQEEVRIRWRIDGVWVQIGTVTTSNTGSANVNLIVPLDADVGANSVRGDGPEFRAQTNAVTVLASPGPATATVVPTRGTVNTNLDFSLSNFPANATVAITWRRTSGSLIEIGTVQTDDAGAASGRFKVPATPGGANQQIRFTAGAIGATALYEVAPRIKVLDAGAPGDEVEVSLRGFDKQETVRIRWKVGESWIEVGTVTASNTGSANLTVTIPAGAAAGNNSVRGDGPAFRAQTNVALVTE